VEARSHELSRKRAHTISVDAVRGSLIFHMAGFFYSQISLPLSPHALPSREKILPNIFSFAASINGSAEDGGREGRIFHDESQPT